MVNRKQKKQQQVQIQVPAQAIQTGNPMVCSNCGCDTFSPTFKSVFISRLNPHNNTGRDLISTIPDATMCTLCGNREKPVVKKAKAEEDKKIILEKG